ncbi:MAG: hypothetical protein DYG92_08290 [Leptolyngbya sp. PLA1]|nr:hypothetical protein [Leptolyngbya sp. PLA1]
MTLAIIWAALVGGCAGGGTPHPTQSGSPVERPETAGMELCWWIVGDSGEGGAPINHLLEPYASRPVPLSWRAVEAWHANGLRVMAVPVDDVPLLRKSLMPVGAVQTQWLGQATRWTEIARGPTLAAPLVVGTDSGPLTLSAGGHLKLAMRCWSTAAAWSPEAAGPTVGALQMEIAPIFTPAPARQVLGQMMTEAEPPLMFSRLGLEATLLGEDAILIIAEGPGESATGRNVRGPEDLALPTLGEAILVPERGEARGGRRVVVVLTPSVPRAFRLLATDSVR